MNPTREPNGDAAGPGVLGLKPGALEFVLNGAPVSIRDVSPNTTLLEFLRGNRLTGAKEGCAEGDCGACSVVLMERDASGNAAYRAVNSCLLPVCLLAGRQIVSVEGVGSSSTMHPVQEKLVEHHGSQCGYCTPGFVCSLFEGFYRRGLEPGPELDEQLAGNLCRCTGYRPICDAAREAFLLRSGEDAFARRLMDADLAFGAAAYENNGEKFYRPATLPELWRQISGNPRAILIAGATELGLDITKRYRRFPALISMEAVAELKSVERTESEWRIGAAVTLTEIWDLLGEEFPMLADMLRVFGSRQIRNRATMGGNLVTASPIGDSAPVLLALDAGLVLASPVGERTAPIGEFFVAYRKTALQSNEILKSIVIPRGVAPGLVRKSAWIKVSKRREMDISTVAAALLVDVDSQNVVRRARLAYGGVAATPSRARKTEAALLGRVWNAATIQLMQPILRNEFNPISDVRGSAAYRRGLITGLLEKFCFDSAGAAPGSPVAKSEIQTFNIQTGPSEFLGRCNRAVPHESARKHVTGEAVYTDDFAAGKDTYEVWPVCSPHARARILRRDALTARQMPGVAAILLAEDVPGLNDVGAVRHDEVLLADTEVSYHGQIVALVVGSTQEACRNAAAKVVVEYEPLRPILHINDAIEQNSFHAEPNFIRRGDVQYALKESPLVLAGEFHMAGQEHFYLEMQAARAEPGEDGTVAITSSTQHPSEVQHVVAHVLGVPVNHVVVQCPRMGGGFGGKETQAAIFAALAALAAAKTNRPVRVRVNRDLDMMITGKRHPFLAKFKVGYTPQGALLAAKIDLFSNAGWSLDLSLPVTDRAMFHLDNAYYIPAVEFSGRAVRTNLASNTAFRGFGGPQGMLVIEEILDRIARRLGKPPEEIRERNLYRGRGETNTTPYGQEIEDNRIERIWRELKKSSAFAARRVEIAKWNKARTHVKRGLAMTPVKFGISFTLTHLNQAGALVLLYQDGTAQVNHGATEMGQGVHTNIAMIAARELGMPLEKVRVMPTSTDKVPNTSATAASCGTDLNGMAVKNACDNLRARLAPVAAQMLSSKLGHPVSSDNVAFGNDRVFEVGDVLMESLQSDRRHFIPAGELTGDGRSIPLASIVQAAYFQRISLSATGYYRTPEIHYDRAEGKGRPFLYFACGAAVAEVEVDGFTGAQSILRVDILHDVGDSINPAINLGQIEGGFVQGAGWLTCEELVWDDEGALLTHSPDTYKIPAVGDRPREFNVRFLDHAAQTNTIHGSKAVGEPPLMLAISVREAIREAVAAFGEGAGEVPLSSPATCEAVWMAIQKRKQSPARPSLVAQAPAIVHPHA